MILTDPTSRDTLLAEQGGKCALLGCPIQDHQTGILVRTQGQTSVLSWLAGIAFDEAVQTEAASREFEDVFVVRTWPVPESHNIANPATARWFDQNKKGWWTLLSWAAWITVSDPQVSVDDRAWCWSVLMGLDRHLWRSKERLDRDISSRVVYPAQAVKHGFRMGLNNRHWEDDFYAVANHQLLLLAGQYRWNSLASLITPETVDLVRSVVATDQTAAIFQPDRWWSALACPIDPETLPFVPDARVADGWSVVQEIRDFAPRVEQASWTEWGRELAIRIADTAQAHQVDPDSAASMAAEVAIGACASIFPKGLSGDQVTELLEAMGKPQVNLDNARTWVNVFADHS